MIGVDIKASVTTALPNKDDSKTKNGTEKHSFSNSDAIIFRADGKTIQNVIPFRSKK